MKIIKYLLFVILLFVAFMLGIATKRYIDSTCIKKDSEGYFLLGKLDDKKVYGKVFSYKDSLGELNYSIKFNDEIVYLGTDKNGDGKFDVVNHFENNKLIYFAQDTNNDGYFNRRSLESYTDKGNLKETIGDLNADNQFDVRFIYTEERINPDIKKDSIIEIFFKGKWVKRIKKDGGQGIEINGQFKPVKFNHDSGEWEIKHK